MKWLPPENDLIKEQRDFNDYVCTSRGNVYINGFPGSGKSVCLLYAVHKIRKHRPNASIIFVEYTHSLIKMIEAALNELRINDVEVVTYKTFMEEHPGPYDFIVCDEVQDMSAQLLKAMNARAERVIVGGDPNQSIYDELKGFGPTITSQEMKRILNPETVELTVLHRLNRYVIRAINSFMPEMRMLAEKSSMLKMHKQPYIWHCPNELDEAKRIMDDAKTALNYGDSVAILLPTHKKIEQFVNLHLQNCQLPPFDFSQERQFGKPNYGLMNDYLSSHGIRMQALNNGFGSLISDSHKIILSTYHSSKGLDFDKVFMPFCNPNPKKETEPRLFMVAMSRSRKDLTLSYTWAMNKYIQLFCDNPQACQHIDFCSSSNTNNLNATTSDEEDDW